MNKKFIGFVLIVAIVFGIGGYYLGRGSANTGGLSMASVFDSGASNHRGYIYSCVGGGGSFTMDNDFSSPSSYTVVDVTGWSARCDLVVLSANRPTNSAGLFKVPSGGAVATKSASSAESGVSATIDRKNLALVPQTYHCSGSGQTFDVSVDWGPGGGPSSFTTTTPNGKFTCTLRVPISGQQKSR